MIIDLHTHIWSSLDQLGRELAEQIRSRQGERWAQLDASPAAHERAMECVSAAAVIGFRSDLLAAHIPNEYIAEFVAADPTRRIGIAGIDPMSADAIDQLRSAIDLGLAGAAVSPAPQGFHPAHSRAMRLYERCAEFGMPVFVSRVHPLTASAIMEFARPSAWDEVARAFPTLPILISQLGDPWIDEALVLVGKHANIYADISGLASRPWQLYTALLGASNAGVMRKLLFGSGFPHETPERTIEALYTVNAYSHGTQLPTVPRSSIRAIVERDSLACLGIDVEVAAPRLEADEELEAIADRDVGRRGDHSIEADMDHRRAD